MAGIGTSIEIVDRVSGSLNRITASLYSTTSAFGSVDRASEMVFNNTAGVQAITQEIYAYEQRVQQLEADLVDANRRLEQMEEQNYKVAQSANVIESAFHKVAGAVAAIGIGAAIKQQVSEAVEYASDLMEVQNVVDTVFGENSAVNDWASNTLYAVGLNELSAKQFAGTMGAMLSSSGVAQEQIESMSMSIAELSGDMASFYNLDAEDAFTKIRSGLSGETEPLKQLGIDMSVASLEAYALSQGMEAAYSEMSRAEQTLLRYDYLLSVTGNAQGDFARTSDSYANQTKLLHENWRDFTGELAEYAIPVLAQITQRLNEFVSSLSGYVPTFVAIGSIAWNILSGILEGISTVGGFTADNWSVISPIIYGVVAALAVYGAYLGITKGIELASTLASTLHSVAMSAKIGITAALTGSTMAATAAQMGYNGALYACPIVWIIILIIALVAAIIALCNWISKTTGITESGLGIITGLLAVSVAFTQNIIVGLINFIITSGIGLYNMVCSFASGLQLAFTNPIDGIKVMFLSLFTFIGSVIEGAASLLDAVFGSSLAETVAGINEKIQAEINATLEANGMESQQLNASDYTLDRVDYGNAFNFGAQIGDGISDKISTGLDGLVAMLDTSAIDSAYTATDSGSVADSLSSIAGDTAAISDSVDISNENLKYLRDVAERDVINRFTTAEIKVDMQNNNTISNGMDIDGVVEELKLGVQEAMEQAAEGVHE